MIYKRKKWYWMDNTVNGLRYREPLKTKNWQEAKQKEKDRLIEIAQGKTGARGPAAKQTFNAAVDAYIDERQLHSAEKTYRTDRERSRALRSFFGERPLKKITAHSILEYQKQRRNEVSGRTVNLEVGLLRRVLRKNKQWSRLAEDVRMLPERPKAARVMTPTEKLKLLEIARSKDEWRVAYCAAILALNTTCRSCELRGLRWNAVDWSAMTITIHRESTKTNAGARVIPLNADALVALMELRDRAEKVGSREPHEFVFPACEGGHFDPTRPMRNWRTAWRKLTRAISCPQCGTLQQPGVTCKVGECHADIKAIKSAFHGLRFHDLRHQAVTELAEKGLSDQTIMSIAGHVNRQMLDHYSHIRMEAKRKALQALESSPSATATSQFTSQMVSGEIFQAASPVE